MIETIKENWVLVAGSVGAGFVLGYKARSALEGKSDEILQKLSDCAMKSQSAASASARQHENIRCAKPSAAEFYDSAEVIAKALATTAKESWEGCIRGWVRVLCRGVNEEGSVVLQCQMTNIMTMKATDLGLNSHYPQVVVEELLRQALVMFKEDVARLVYPDYYDEATSLANKFAILLTSVRRMAA